jgi:hypothetical protein
MTLGALDIEEIKKRLTDRSKSVQPPALPPAHTKQEAIHLSGKVLARRLKGLVGADVADTFERHINESCEQEND